MVPGFRGPARGGRLVAVTRHSLNWYLALRSWRPPFALIFARLRRQVGFETAYQFYHKNGGRRAFGCSFQNYLRIENGANLPVPKRLPELCLHLRLPLRGADMRGLNAYAVFEKTERSGLFFVESKVFKLSDF